MTTRTRRHPYSRAIGSASAMQRYRRELRREYRRRLWHGLVTYAAIIATGSALALAIMIPAIR